MNVVPLFDARKLEFKRACDRHFAYHQTSPEPDNRRFFEECCRLQAEFERTEAALLATPALSLADAAYKIELSLGYIDDVCCSATEDMAKLKRALVALQSGSAATAIKLLNDALNGEAEYEFCYEGAAAALADLRRLSA